LLAPAAQALGIDLVWFGILLGANMQTSFMHPPFGFALFYLHGISPPQVRSRDIYWGAVPWVALQLILVGLLIAFPGIVTFFLEAPADVDLESIEIDIPSNTDPSAPPAIDLSKPPDFGQ
jgi:TRAP-type mannitol/chloroaromatic compound transport system permease large subunit